MPNRHAGRPLPVVTPGADPDVIDAQQLLEMTRFVQGNDANWSAFEAVGNCLFALMAA